MCFPGLFDGDARMATVKKTSAATPREDAAALIHDLSTDAAC